MPSILISLIAVLKNRLNISEFNQGVLNSVMLHLLISFGHKSRLIDQEIWQLCSLLMFKDLQPANPRCPVLARSLLITLNTDYSMLLHQKVLRDNMQLVDVQKSVLALRGSHLPHKA